MQNTREELIIASKSKKIICFGAGKFLKNVKAFLDSEALTLDILIDNNKSKWGMCEYGVEIQAPDSLKNCSEEEYLILISTKNFAKEIQTQIEQEYSNKFTIFKWPLSVTEVRKFDDKLWQERIYTPCELLYKHISLGILEGEREVYMQEKRTLLSDKGKVILPRTPLMITTRCTLRCKECSNLMPYYKNPQDYKADEIITWIKNVCDAIDEWICLELVGGEPFLYKDLEKVLAYVLKEEKIQQVEFTTNASVIPNQEVINLLKNEKIFVKISQYSNLINPTKVLELLRENGIRHELMENMRWTKTGKLTSRERTKVELQSQYLNCGPAKLCRTILNGKLYVCSKAASLMELGYVDNLEWVDLTKTKSLRERLADFMRLPYSEACNYCDMASADEEIVEPAVQMERWNSNE